MDKNHFSRSDRGKNEYDTLVFIPISKLKDVTI